MEMCCCVDRPVSGRWAWVGAEDGGGAGAEGGSGAARWSRWSQPWRRQQPGEGWAGWSSPPSCRTGWRGGSGGSRAAPPAHTGTPAPASLYIHRDIRGVFKAVLRIQNDLMRIPLFILMQIRFPLFILMRIRIRIYLVSKTFNKFWKIQFINFIDNFLPILSNLANFLLF